jgi:hypothetical protein
VPNAVIEKWTIYPSYPFVTERRGHSAATGSRALGSDGGFESSLSFEGRAGSGLSAPSGYPRQGFRVILVRQQGVAPHSRLP